MPSPFPLVARLVCRNQNLAVDLITFVLVEIMAVRVHCLLTLLVEILGGSARPRFWVLLHRMVL